MTMGGQGKHKERKGEYVVRSHYKFSLIDRTVGIAANVGAAIAQMSSPDFFLLGYAFFLGIGYTVRVAPVKISFARFI